MRKKLLPSMGLVVALSATTLGGCESDPGAEVAQRDVYSGPNALQDCIADWGNAELCQQQLDAAEKQAAGAPAAGTAGSNAIFLWGPAYIPAYGRYTEYNGRRYEPSSYRARNAASFAPSRGGAARSLTGFSSNKTSVGKVNSYAGSRGYGTTSSRGGFGSTASRSGGFGG